MWVMYLFSMIHSFLIYLGFLYQCLFITWWKRSMRILDVKLLKSNSESVEFISSASLNSAIPASPMLLSVVFHIKMIVVGWSITCGIHYWYHLEIVNEVFRLFLMLHKVLLLQYLLCCYLLFVPTKNNVWWKHSY